MSAEEKVIIRVEIDADINDDMARIEARLKSLQRNTRSLDRESARLDRTTNRLDRRFGRFNNTLTRVTGALAKFVGTLAKLSFIALTAQIGLFTAGLVGVKAALVTGRYAVKAYEASLAGLSVAAAGVATAISTAVAAMRQFNEVQLSPYFGGGQAGTTAAARFRRQLATSPISGLLGGEATAAVTASLARAGVPINSQSRVATQIFNLAGGDTTQATRIANALGAGNLEASVSAVNTSAGFRKDSLKGVTDTAGLLSAITSGAVVADNFNSLAADMAMTFVGTLKTEFVGFKELLGDIGEPLLEPVRVTFQEISRIIKDDLIAMSGIVQQFGADSLAPTLVTAVDKVSEFFRSNIMHHLDRVDEISDNFLKFFRAIGSWMRGVGNWFKALEPAADVVIDMFRAMGGAAGGRTLFQNFQKLVVDNASGFIALGESLGNVFGAIFDLLSTGQGGFFNKLPTIADSFNVIAERVIPALGGLAAALMPIFEQLPNVLESVASVLESLVPVVHTLATAVGGLLGALGGGGLAGLAVLGLGTGAGRGALFGRRLPGGGRAGGVFGGGAMSAGGLGLGIAGMGVYGAYQQGGGTGNLLMGVGGGALAGGAIGSMIAPGIGTAVGAVAGAIVGGVAGWFASNAGQARIREEVSASLGALGDVYSGIGPRDVLDIPTSAGRDAFLAEIKREQRLYGLASDRVGVGQQLPDENELRNFIESVVYNIPDSGLYDNQIGLLTMSAMEGVVDSNLQSVLNAYPELQTQFDEIMGGGSSRQAGFDFWKKSSPGHYMDVMTLLAERTGKSIEDLEKLGADDLMTEIEKFASDLGGSLPTVAEKVAELNDKMLTLTDSLGMTEDSVLSLIDEFGLSLDRLDVVGFRNFITELERAQQIARFDREQTFVPSTLTTPAGQAAAQETAKGTRDELFAAASAGNYDPAMLQRFLDSQMVLEVASGTDPYLAYASSITSLMSQTGTGFASRMGVNPEEFSQMFDLPGLLAQSYTMIEEALGAQIPTLLRETASPSLINSWVASQQRGAQAFTDVAAGDTRGLSNLDDVTLSKFDQFLQNSDTTNFTLEELKTSGETQNEDLKTVWAEFNGAVLDIDGARNNLLEEILTAVAKPVGISVTGDVSETSNEQVTLSFTVHRQE